MEAGVCSCPRQRNCPYGKVAVIGAGAVGATYAYTLMLSSIVQEIVLLDANPERAKGEAADLSHCTPYGRQVDVYAGALEDCRDVGLIVITAGVAQKPGETRLQLVERNVEIFKTFIPPLSQLAPRAIQLIVTNPVDIMTRVAQLLSGLPSRQVLGSGTVLDSARHFS